MKTSPFQIGVIAFFVVFVIVAMLIFTGIIKVGGDTQEQTLSGNVTVWGTYPQEVMGKIISERNASNQKTFAITYIPISSADLSTRLAEAIASGGGPDLVVLSQDQILKNASKLYPIPYESLPEATVRATFAGEGELFMLPGGTLGLPMSIDPLILYYNRDLLEGAGITVPPKTWNEVAKITPLLTKKDVNNNVIQSAIPFGIYSNLNNARDIVAMLLLQAGSPIVAKQAASFIPVLSGGVQTAGTDVLPPAQAVVSYFTQFVDPTKDTYTWNRAFKNARTEFIGGELAMYVGYASELPTIVSQNPNLNFDIAKVPQAGTAGAQITFGRMHAIAVVKASKNLGAALAAASEMTGADFAKKVVDAMLPIIPVAPARRDLLSQVPQNAFAPILYASAIIARGWYDPGVDVTDPIFNDMIDDVVRGASTISQAVGDAQSRFTVIFGK